MMKTSCMSLFYLFWSVQASGYEDHVVEHQWIVNYDFNSPECLKHFEHPETMTIQEKRDQLESTWQSIIYTDERLNEPLYFNANWRNIDNSYTREQHNRHRLNITESSPVNQWSIDENSDAMFIYPSVKITWLRHLHVDIIKHTFKDWKGFLEDLKSKLPCIQSVFTENALFSPQALSKTSIQKMYSRRYLGKKPNDPYAYTQWNLDAVEAINAWDRWYPQRDQVPLIGLIDMGCDLTNKDLLHAFHKNPGEICDNGIDDDGNGYIDDCYGFNFYDGNADLQDESWHGTVIAGAIAAEVNNSYGISGYCPTCQIVCAKIGQNSFSDFAFIEAVNYLISRNVKVISFSATGTQTALFDAALTGALNRGILFVASTTNSGCDLKNRDCYLANYPAMKNHAAVLSVGATCSDGKLCEFSTRGSESLDILAPGLIPTLGRYTEITMTTGSSISVAAVTSAAAYLWSLLPHLTAESVANILRKSATISRDLEGLTSST